MTAPVRTCLGCGATAPQGELVRLRVAEGAMVIVDAKRSGGRGAWLHPAETCLERALKRRAFARAFKRGDLQWDGAALRRGFAAVGGRD